MIFYCRASPKPTIVYDYHREMTEAAVVSLSPLQRTKSGSTILRSSGKVGGGTQESSNSPKRVQFDPLASPLPSASSSYPTKPKRINKKWITEQQQLQPANDKTMSMPVRRQSIEQERIQPYKKETSLSMPQRRESLQVVLPLDTTIPPPTSLQLQWQTSGVSAITIDEEYSLMEWWPTTTTTHHPADETDGNQQQSQPLKCPQRRTSNNNNTRVSSMVHLSQTSNEIARLVQELVAEQQEDDSDD